MEKADVDTTGADSQVLEMEKLNETMERQRTEIARLRNLLDLTGAGKVLAFDCGSGTVVLKTFFFLHLANLFNCYRLVLCLIYQLW